MAISMLNVWNLLIKYETTLSSLNSSEFELNVSLKDK